MADHLLVLDEGTTSTRAVLFDDRSRVVDDESRRLLVATPTSTTVEQDATEIAEKSVAVLRAVVGRARERDLPIAALGITNQRTTTVLWDRSTGEPVRPVISWQDTRAQRRVTELTREWGDRFTARTGGQLQASCTALHLAELLADPELRRRADAGELLAGTVDSWVIWKLTGRHATSYSNASSSGAFDLVGDGWYAELLDELGVPSTILPEVLHDDGDFGTTDEALVGAALPVRADVADQQSALFGHGGFEAGAVKCTHGTGTFIDFNIGSELKVVGVGLDTRIAWRSSAETRYLVEGASLVTGSAVEWLIHGLKVLDGADRLDEVCTATPDTAGVVVVPALAGFTAPHWDQTARGTVFGLHRGVTNHHLVKATVQGIARTAADLVLAIADRSGTKPEIVLADGGLSRSAALLQAQADFTGAPVERATDAEFVTARGTAWMAGIATGVWADKTDAAARTTRTTRIFEPSLDPSGLAALRRGWDDAVQRSLGWHPQPEPGSS